MSGDRTSDLIRAHGLDLEVAAVRPAGPLIAGRRPRRWAVWPVYAVAAALIGLLLLGPAATTLWLAVCSRPLLVTWCGLAVVAVALWSQLWKHDPPIRTFSAAIWRGRSPRWRSVLSSWIVRGGGGGHRRPRWQPAAWTVAVALFFAGIAGAAMDLNENWLGPYVRTVIWVLCALVILVVALELAWWSRAHWCPWQPLVLPFAVSPFVAGLAFRLLGEYPGARAPLPGISGERLWLMVLLIAAFAWSWLGALFALFRAAVAVIESDPVRLGYVLDAGSARRVRMRLFELMRPVFLILGLVVAVAAARIFDIILVVVPGSLQYTLDSATVQWWRLVSDPAADPGVAAAYSLPLVVLVGIAAWLLQTDVRRHRVGWLHRVPAAPVRPRRSVRGTAAVTVAALLSVGPLLALAAFSWVGTGGPAFTGRESVLRHHELWQAMLATGAVAVGATIVVVGLAFPVAHRLAAVSTERWWSRASVVGLVVLTVLPAQMYVGPIRRELESLGMPASSVSALILVHAAIGLPIAILILRGALLAPRDAGGAGVLVQPWTMVGRAAVAAWPAIGAVAVLELVQVWNDFFVGLMVSGADMSPWSLLLWGEARQFQENAAQLAAAGLICAVPPLLLLIVSWRRLLVPGLTGGFVR
ncbi:MAG: hypothetical protein J2P18_17025 [Nocardia sp.]|nr:hypothetical protein [Nocardia sp.]